MNPAKPLINWGASPNLINKLEANQNQGTPLNNILQNLEVFKVMISKDKETKWRYNKIIP